MSYVSDAENLADLVGRMPQEDQEVFNRYGHLRIESGFNGRLFVVYRTVGLTQDKAHRAPEVLTTVRLSGFTCDAWAGASALVTDTQTGQTQTVSHVPTRLFHYPVFISLPSVLRIRWDARPTGPGPDPDLKRSLSYAIMVKTRNRSDFFSQGNTYCETPNDFRALFPKHVLNLNFA